MRVALLLGLVHVTTDLATVTALVRATDGRAATAAVVFGWFLAYDVVAFGGQPFVGLVADRLRAGPVVLAGVGVAALGVAVAAAGGRTAAVGLAAVLLAALGNAVTHVGAGVVVLRGDLTRAAPAGLLVAPGALGLGLGLWFGRDPGLGPTWWAAVPLAAAVVLVLRLHRGGALEPSPARRRSVGERAGERSRPAPALRLTVLAVLALLVSVAIRSLVGASSGRGYEAGAWLTAGVPLAAFAGKALGGLLADRLGWLVLTVGALVTSAPLLAVHHAHPALLLTGLLVFQMTMPVTLVAVGRLLPSRPGTAFGLPCAALLVGALPASFGWGEQISSRPLLGGWVVLSAIAAWAGLTGAGLGWRRGAGAADRTVGVPAFTAAGGEPR